VTLIDTKRELERTVSLLRGHGSFGLDMEFQRERTFRPRLQLVQVSLPDEPLLIDPLALPDLDPLWELVADPSIEKIVHAGAQDMEIVFVRSGLLPKNVFDTQIAAALLGLGDQIGYANLIARMLHKRLKKGETVTDWAMRPLTPGQLEYALDDVRYLHELRGRLWDRLTELGRAEWLREEVEHYEHRGTYERDPETLWTRISRMRSLDRRGLTILRELAIWREEEAARRDEPRGRIVADETLVEIARRAPRRPEEMKPLRTLHPRELARSGPGLVAAVARGLARPEEEWPKLEPVHAEDERFSITVDLLEVVLRARALEFEIAPSYLGTRADIAELIHATLETRNGRPGRGRDADGDPNLLLGWRRTLIGDELVAFLQGHASLKIDEATGFVHVIKAGA
jgi:ribonuclease D